MSHLAQERRPTPGDTQAVRQLRRHVQSAFIPAQRALEQIKALVDAQGKANIETDLGEHSAELVETYNALKLLVVTLDPEAVVPDLE